MDGYPQPVYPQGGMYVPPAGFDPYYPPQQYAGKGWGKGGGKGKAPKTCSAGMACVKPDCR